MMTFRKVFSAVSATVPTGVIIAIVCGAAVLCAAIIIVAVVKKKK